jgi:hypothetical protein
MGNYWLDLDLDKQLEEEIKEFMDKFEIWGNIETWEVVLKECDLPIWYESGSNGITAVYKHIYSTPAAEGIGCSCYLVERGTALHEAIAGLLGIHYELKEKYALEKDF